MPFYSLLDVNATFAWLDVSYKTVFSPHTTFRGGRAFKWKHCTSKKRDF